MKHNLAMSRIIVTEEIKEGASDPEDLYKGLFSVSGRTRPPQNDVEFGKRANEANKVSLESSMDRSTVSGKSDGKKADFEKLMACISNCGFEFDNESTFLANKNALRRTARLPPQQHLDANDPSDEDE